MMRNNRGGGKANPRPPLDFVAPCFNVAAMDGMAIAMMVAGLVVLTVGGEMLIRGASRLAALLGLSPLVIGLTVVAYGTSAPEMAVSIQAGLQGNPHIAVANVVGSNIFNILFILGLCALLLPLTVTPQLVRRDVPVMIAASVLTLILALDGKFGRWDALLLLVGLVVYTATALRAGRRERAPFIDEYAADFGQAPEAGRSVWRVIGCLLLLVAGLALLVVGSRWFVQGAVQVARWLGVSDVIIGLTIVAAGTSLPEVAASIIAALRKERDIAIGNAVGSNICNLLAILGVSGLVTPGGLEVAPQMLHLDLPFMVAVALICLPIFYHDYTITRRDGALLFAGYVVYTLYLVLHATGSDLRAVVGKWAVLGGVVVGSFVITLALRSWHRKRRVRKV